MKSVTLLALGPSRKECPFETEELWGTVDCLNQDNLRDKRFTKVFAFDSETVVINNHPPRRIDSFCEYIDRAKQLKIPLVSTRDYATEKYPLREIITKFKSSYFMPTVSYMIAYALYLEYDRLYIFGIDQGPQWWYQLGKPHITFWIGYAIALGAEVLLGTGSLRWTYQPGIDNLPEAWIREEYEKFYNTTFDNVVVQK